MHRIRLNIFTNCSLVAPETDCVMQTYESFRYTFDPARDVPVTVYLDRHPNPQHYTEYKKNLSRYFDNIVATESLADGYVRSIQDSPEKYLFQLEHDWIFLHENITHTLSFILDVMEVLDIYHFRFNKRVNRPAGWDTELQEQRHNDFCFCISPNMSNNPHILKRKIYAGEMLRHIKVRPGSLGVERELNAVGKYKSMLYGALGHPATIFHLDGRR